MSINKPSANDRKNEENSTHPSERSNTIKKRTSPGFIETSGFKPNWLETGPLTPEMLLEHQVLDQTNPEVAEVTEVTEDLPVIEEPIELPPAAVEFTEEATQPGSIETSDSIPELSTSDEHPPTASSHTDEEPDTWVQVLFDDDVSARAIETTETMLATDQAYSPLAESEDEFVVEDMPEPFAHEESPVRLNATVAEPHEKERTTTVARTKKRDRWSVGLLVMGSILLGIGALIYFINPLTRMALNSATLAQPLSPSTNPSPQTGSGSWCVQGNFLGNTESPRLVDNASQGDMLAGDQVFSLDQTIDQPGTYRWQVVDCDNPSLAYPEAAAWFNTTEPNQPVTFAFDTLERNDSLFTSVPYVVNTIDATHGFRVVGSFQGWDEADSSSKMDRISDGLYQQVRRIAEPGFYEASYLANDSTQSVDAYGRTDNPTPFSFQVNRRGDYVVFLLDADRGQGSVLYGMSPTLTSLAFNGGYRIISFVLIGLAALLFVGMLLRLMTINNKNLRMERGCPSCGQQELMRISRHTPQRVMNFFGIPAYRYRCRNCTWEGTRLSDAGEAVSPGALFTQADDYVSSR